MQIMTMQNMISDYFNNKDIYKYGINNIIKGIKNKRLPFPYLHYRLKEDDVIKKFNNLSHYKPNIKKGLKYDVINLKNNNYFDEKIMKFRGEYTLMVKDKTDYLSYNILSDYFNEECRMKCKRYDSDMSPYEYWLKFTNRVVYGAYTKYKKITMYTLRETIYMQSRECTSFRPTLIVSAIKMFNATHILDFSAGWGDRLIGAMASKVKFYCGVDPNPCLHPNYNKMIKLLKDNKTEVKMIQSRFEILNDKDIPNKEYDLVFTSPPYFILEEYTTHKDQSIKHYENVDDWFNKFLMEAIKKVWDRLIINGHMIIIINNIRNYPDFVGRMIQERSKFVIDNDLAVSTYLGVISYAEERTKGIYKSPQPMWIWKKESITDKLNPPFIIKSIQLDNDRSINIIRDDLITGGTAIRGMTYIFNKINANIYTFADSYTSYLIPAISYIGYVLKKKIIIYTSIPKNVKVNNDIGMINEALSYGFTEIKDIDSNIYDLDKKAMEDTNKMIKNGKKAYHIPLNMDFEDYNTYLISQIKKAWPNKSDPKRLWVTSNNGIMANIFAKAFPKSFINIVYFDKNMTNIDISSDRIKLYNVIAKDDINKPPYPSLKSDAKMWNLILKYAKDDDYVLNKYRDPSTKLNINIE